MPATRVTEQTLYPTAVAAARAYAASVGVEGRRGGWLYNARGTALCQGWAAYVGILARHHVLRDVDGRTMACVSGTERRNVFADGPVTLDVVSAMRFDRAACRRVVAALCGPGA